MFIAGIVCLFIGLVFIIYSFVLSKNTHKINKDIDEQNKKIRKENEELDYHNKYLLTEFKDLTAKQDKINEIINIKQNELDDKERQLNQAQKQIDVKQKELSHFQDNITKVLDNQKELSQKAFESYCETLEKQYEEQEKDYERYKDALETSYSNLQLKLLKDAEDEKASIQEELETIREELAKIKATREAVLAAQLKEKEISDNKDNFRLNISESSKKDIRLLKSIQSDITNSIVIDKIIWSNYYQPLAKIKFPKIIGKSTACGIYKITSLTTGASYIGQSTDCCDRWKQHCKNALGVGNIVNENKLYKAMKEEGLYNFTFEILEECDKSLLDEKEKYYIELYQSYDFGLNGNRGNH